MTDREALYRAVVAAALAREPAYPVPVPATEMGVLADWLDENGEPDLAFAYRWAARRGHFPRLTPKGRYAGWSAPLRGQHKLAWPHQLPRVVFARVKGGRSRSVEGAFAKLAAALAELRAAVAC